MPDLYPCCTHCLERPPPFCLVNTSSSLTQLTGHSLPITTERLLQNSLLLPICHPVPTFIRALMALIYYTCLTSLRGWKFQESRDWLICFYIHSIQYSAQHTRSNKFLWNEWMSKWMNGYYQGPLGTQKGQKEVRTPAFTSHRSEVQILVPIFLATWPVFLGLETHTSRLPRGITRSALKSKSTGAYFKPVKQSPWGRAWGARHHQWSERWSTPKGFGQPKSKSRLALPLTASRVARFSKNKYRTCNYICISDNE